MGEDDVYSGGIKRYCIKCGEKISPHISAYNSWDERFTLTWMPASDDGENVRESESGGKHPEKQTRVFCSRDCLDAFIQMDYSLKPQPQEAATDGGQTDE
jgi:hypothetical protein